ncbi:hypothetical protein [Nannocystis punicea]|uniref:HEAT repeat domain-containing protein n=1 Tax=Nannocystis punicea TaxID=2995304 RepID=A0ABY7H6S0_9BACT|nr:hypothetical protein [Nannocystis poenicansa]WAS94971.1 hypothetical protein O0S08_02315 [Nannocystis poenicansa]
MKEDLLVRQILGRFVPELAPGVVPDYLEPLYARETAVRAAGCLSEISLEIEAALLRALFADEEEDVRAAARRVILDRCAHLRHVVLVSMTQDEDEWVRESALDEVGPPAGNPETALLRAKIAALLGHDRDENIRERAQAILRANSGEESA